MGAISSIQAVIIQKTQYFDVQDFSEDPIKFTYTNYFAQMSKDKATNTYYKVGFK